MQQKNELAEDEMSIGELMQKFKSIWSYLLSNWVRILIVCLLGSAIGILYSWITPIKYQSKLTFVVEEGKAGGGGLAALAGQFGVDIGSSGTSALFSGENVLLFLKSESLCRETLLTFYDENGTITLADKYAEVTKLKKSWLNSNDIGQVNFASYVGKKMPRLHDSLLQILVRKRILLTDLQVLRPEKKASFIEIKVLMLDEKLSALFSERLVKIATQKYVESKTRVKAINVAILQRRADSLAALLDQKTFNSAFFQQSLVDLNPALRTAPVYAEISTRDKAMIATIFGEVVKNLEISKTILSQETPFIQMVDQSSFPLEQIRFRKLKGLLLGGLIAGIFYIFILLVFKWVQIKIK